jgi:hypothetical protein
MMPVRRLDSPRNPFELFLLFLGLASAFPLLWGAPTPGSTAELLGPVLVRVWGYILVFGCLTALTGVWWTWLGRLFHRRTKPQEVAGLLIEQVGLVAVGVGTLVYGVGLIGLDTQGRGVVVGIAFGWGLACFWRAGQIQRWVRAAIREQDHCG